MIHHRVLWAPDIVKESNGIACGDMLSLSAYRENDKLVFSYSGNACEVALKIAQYLEDTFSGKEEIAIQNAIKRFRSGQYMDSERWIAENLKNRRACVESPISLLYETIHTDSMREVDTGDQAVLACDACVHTKTLNWKPETKKRQKSNLREVVAKIRNIDNQKEIEFQKLALCVLTKEQKEIFQKTLESITDTDFELIKKLRLASLFVNNARKYGLKIDRQIEGLAVKQIVSLAVANEEIKVIDEYISIHRLRIDAVKGGKTNQYYTPGCVRTHMDYDYLAAEFEDAFKLITFLINNRNFKMVVGGSVPFSLKSVMNFDGEEVLTGHIHLEKILQDKYQVVVDINMGGFPLGRTGIIQCNREGAVELEDLICITVSHLFKHEYAFMKDINDLYYLLESEEFDDIKLLKKIEKYGLSNLFAIIYDFLKKYMGLNLDLQVKSESIISQKRKEAWPFSRKAHFYIKAIDMLTLNRVQYGIEKGTKETVNQICGATGEIPSSKYQDLCTRMNERIYLYPVTFFVDYVRNLNLEALKEVAPKMMRFNQLLVLPIGIFLIQNGDQGEIDRQILNHEVELILQMLGLNEDICNQSYIMEARKDTWLY